jgi:hypothetical protein
VTADFALLRADREPLPAPRSPAPTHVVVGADLHAAPGQAEPHGHRTPRDGRPPDGEEQWITGVVNSLIATFPEVPEPHIRDCVAYLRARFANARIRTYVPILVARQARAALAGYSPNSEGQRVG